MRIAIANVTSGGLSGGYRKYLARLMPLLAADPRVAQLTVLVPEQAGALLDPALEVRSWPAGDARRGYPTLRREIERLAPDVVFIPTARHLRFGDTPVVTMIRNMEPLSVPLAGHTVAEGLKNLARAWEARRSARRADRVIAVSEHVRDFLVSRWRLDASRIGVAYHGVDAGAEPERPRAATIFTAGSIRPARGLEDLLRALPLLPETTRVTIAGRVDEGCERYGARLRAIIRERRLEARVTWPGQLDAGAMAVQFASAGVFVMTSRAEACPNTALEAMSHGCPIVSIDRPPMPEFFRDAALYYRTGDPAMLAAHIGHILSDAPEQRRLGELARARAAHFTWEAASEKTIDELEQVVG